MHNTNRINFYKKHTKSSKLNQTFVNLSDDEFDINIELDYNYFSDNENIIQLKGDKFHKQFKTKNQVIIHFIESSSVINKRVMQFKLKQPKFKLRQEIASKNNQNIFKGKSGTIKIFRKFVEHLKIVPNKQESKHYNFNKFDLIEIKPNLKNQTYTQSNKYYDLIKKIDGSFPNLIKFNIPSLLNKYKSLNRKALYELFIQYKILLKLCYLLNHKFKKGVDFESFYNGISKINSEDESIARQIFQVINKHKNGYLSLDEFFEGMEKINSKNVLDKIDIFFEILDIDTNGLLSYSEVCDLSLKSLKRVLKTKNKEELHIIDELSEYFSKLIFNLINVKEDGEIPLISLREVS